MKAIVLAGGYATRLRPISYVIPKLLFPVLNKPMVYWTLDLLKEIHVDTVILAVNYLADQLRSAVGNSYRDIKIQYSLERTPLGTGGPIKLASKNTRLDDTFIVMNGDVITRIDLRKMLKNHASNKASITDALHYVRNPARFGSAELDREQKIKRFIEKPKSNENPSHLINAGIYLIEPEVLGMIHGKRAVSLEREIFPILAREGKLLGFPFSGEWFDIGNFADYQRANFSLLRERAGLRKTDKVPKTKGAVIREPVMLGKGSKARPEASVGPRVIVGENSMIESKAKVSNSILFDNVEIGSDSVISGAILGSRAVVGRRVIIEPGAIVSPYVRLKDGVKIGREAVVHPHKAIDSDVYAGTHAM